MLVSLVRVWQQQRWKNRKKLALLSVTVWEPGTGCHDVETRMWARTQETTDTWDNRERRRDEMQVAIFGVPNTVQRSTPSAVRCTAASWISEVRMPEQVACQSAQVRAVQFVVLCNSPEEIDVTACAQATPSSCPRLVLVAQVRDKRLYALFMTTSSNEPSMTERASVCKNEVLCGWMKHSTT